MDSVADDFRFFKDIVESIPGEAEEYKPIEATNLSRNELKEKLSAKIESLKPKVKEEREGEVGRKQRKNRREKEKGTENGKVQEKEPEKQSSESLGKKNKDKNEPKESKVVETIKAKNGGGVKVIHEKKPRKNLKRQKIEE